MSNALRSISFKDRTQNRYWWFSSRRHAYTPAVFSLLTNKEWSIMEEWYAETDARQSAGEANIPILSFLTGLIEGNSVPNIVQLGHFEGFSTLLLGFTMRRIGHKHSIFTVDVNQYCSEVTAHWIDKAELSDYVCIKTSSSDDAGLPQAAVEYFGSEISSIFVDSSHQYQHTINELNLWFPTLKAFGLIFLHDVSMAASEFDATHNGGVMRGVTEWMAGRSDASYILLNQDVVFGKHPVDIHDLTYHDACGLGIIQKRHPWKDPG